MKVKTRQKMSALVISAIMLIAMFAMVPAAFATDSLDGSDRVNTVRLYGEDDKSAKFPYTHPEGPFDPLNIEAPEKDFMTFNPALLESGIYVNNQDALQKVFARQWFVPEYMEPTGKTWVYQPQIKSEDIVTEYTYMFVDMNYEPVEATPIGDGGLWTRFWLPVVDNDDTQIGLDGFDINGDGNDDMVTLVRAGDLDGGVAGKDIIITSSVFKVDIGEELNFLDHKLNLTDIVISGSPVGVRSMVVDISYTGNDDPDLLEAGSGIVPILPGKLVKAGRHMVDVTPGLNGLTYNQPWFVQAVAVGNSAYIKVGRVLHEGETFFVDGAEYDVARIFGSGGDDSQNVKYITIRNPIPEDVDVELKRLSVTKESVDPNSYLPLLPPFNMEHTMIDDINIPEEWYIDHDTTYYTSNNDGIVNNYDTVGERVIRNIPALDIYFTEQSTETRFHTNLLELLDEEVYEDPVDILFEIDTTGSMGDEIDVVKAQSVAIMTAIKVNYPNANFGLVSFDDYPDYYTYPGYADTYGGLADSPYTLEQPITGNTAAVAAAINGLTLGWGADWPECYTRVLYEAGNDPNIDWRAGAIQIVVIIGDAPTHDEDFYASSTGGDPGRNATAGDSDDLDFETTVAGLASQGIIVMAIDTSNSYSPNNPDEIGATVIDAAAVDDAEMSFRYMAEKTGGEYRKLDNADELPGVIVDILYDYVEVDESWDWLHIHTMPDKYKVFVYPELLDIDTGGYGDFLLTSSLLAPNSDYDAPDDMHSEPQRLMMVYDQAEGLPDIYVDEYSDAPNNLLRVYGEEGITTPNFPYVDAEAPFDPLHDEAPLKDFVTFNPAVVKAGIYVNNKDALQKVFLRQWFVPDYEEPTGETWVHQDKVKSDDVVTEYTYMFVDTDYNPVEGTPRGDGGLWTNMWFPIADNDNSQIGIDGCDVDGDTNDDLVSLKRVGDFNGDFRKDISIETQENFRLEIGDTLTFLDHMIEVQEVSVTASTGLVSLVVDVYYTGEDVPELLEGGGTVVNILPGQFMRAGRHMVDTGVPTFNQPWFLEAVATNTVDGAYIKVGRKLHTGETFFVDGAEYDVAMIFGSQLNSVKYITIRNPIPENDDVRLESLSVTKKAVADRELMPMLPPFNRDHMMIDDIGIPMYSDRHDETYYADDNTNIADRIFDVGPLDIFFTGHYQEERFHTNLLEILDEDKYQETWQWLHIRTMPDLYKAFVYPDVPNVADGYGDYLVTSSLLAPNSIYDVPDYSVNHDENMYNGIILQRFMFAYEPINGTGIYMDDPLALEDPVDNTPAGFDPMVYDVDDSGVIERSEAVTAILDFLDEKITRADVVAVIVLFLG